MNPSDPALERRLRTHFRDARAADPTPTALRTAVLAIPRTAGASETGSWARRRGLTLLAATVAIGAGALGWAVLGGSQPPEPNPSPPAFVVDASPLATPLQTSVPAETPQAPTSTDGPGPVVPNTGEGIAVGWQPAGTMAEPRAFVTATLLLDGRVLVTGGYLGSSDRALASAEIWDPATRTFTPTGSMARARIGHAAALLNDGRVLVVGGEHPSNPLEKLDTEVWDPATGRFEAVGTMPGLPGGLTATTLVDGRVLIVGEEVCLVPPVVGPSGNPDCKGASAATWIWSPDGSYVVGPDPHEPRQVHTATRLRDGRVLLVGNLNWGIDTPESAEVFDPSTDTFIRVGEPKDYIIAGHAATLLGDGTVLIAGGDTDEPNGKPPFPTVLRTVEVWDPASGTFQRAGRMNVPRRALRSALLPDGRAIVVGGSRPRTADFHDQGLATTEIWDPAAGSFTPGPQMAQPRVWPALVTLADGSLLVIGGDADYDARSNEGNALDSAEILDFTPSP